MSRLTSNGINSLRETSTTSCDAHRCKIEKFRGSKEDWVQCDECDKWIHLFCAGLKGNVLEGDDDKKMEFSCEFC